MPRQSPYRIVLSAAEERALTARATKYTRPYFEVLRAKMILLAAEGWSNEAIARSLRTLREVVSLWRKRFFEDRLPGVFPPEVVVTVKALACERRARAQRPLARWSMSELAAETQRTGLVASISGSTIWRWLHDDAIRPWCHRRSVQELERPVSPEAASCSWFILRTEIPMCYDPTVFPNRAIAELCSR